MDRVADILTGPAGWGLLLCWILSEQCGERMWAWWKNLSATPAIAMAGENPAEPIGKRPEPTPALSRTVIPPDHWNCRCQTVTDNRVRPEHAAMDGIAVPQTTLKKLGDLMGSNPFPVAMHSREAFASAVDISTGLEGEREVAVKYYVPVDAEQAVKSGIRSFPK